MTVRAFRQAADDAPAVPHLITELPGPRARDHRPRRGRRHQPVADPCLPARRRVGQWLRRDRRRRQPVLDFAAGIAVAPPATPTRRDRGHHRAGQKLIHIAATDFYEPRYLELSERLAASPRSRTSARLPHQLRHRRRRGRSSWPATTPGARRSSPSRARSTPDDGPAVLTNSKIKQRAGFGPLLPMVYHAPFPRVRSWKEGSGGDGSVELEHLRTAILGRLVSPEDVAAIVFEPIQGEGGYFPPPRPSSAGRARSATSTASSSSPTRSNRAWAAPGRMWAMEWYGVEPDVATVAKGIASGMPLGAFIGREKLFTLAGWRPRQHVRRQPGSCAAASRPSTCWRGPDRQRRGHGRAAAGRGGVRLEECGVVRDIRGKGLMLGVEFASHDEANAVELACFERGLLVLECGRRRSDSARHSSSTRPRWTRHRPLCRGAGVGRLPHPSATGDARDRG